MTSRRDWQLQQLGITQWALRRPGALQGEIAISLPAHVRLIVVAEELPALNEPLMRDILRALTVSPDQVLPLTPERVAMLPQGSRCNSWRLGTDAPLQLEGAQVTTPAFNELRVNPAARAALWQQICEHEHDFYPQHDRSPAAWQIEQRAHAFPWSEKTFFGNQGERYLNFKLTADDRMAAFAITQVVLDEATLFNIAVDPDFQRRGLGRMLLEHLIDELEKRGVVTLWLEVRASNAAAIALYESLGFNEATIRRNYYPTAQGHEDASSWRYR